MEASWENVSSISDLVHGGYETNGKEVYVCRATKLVFGGGYTVSGQLSLEKAACFVVYKEKTYVLTLNFQVLTNPKKRYLRWLSIIEDPNENEANKLTDYVDKAVVAGYLQDEEEYMYVGRFNDGFGNWGLHPGYVLGTSKKFYFLNQTQCTEAKEWKTLRTDIKVKVDTQYELLVAEYPDKFQQLDDALLTYSNSLIWMDTNYTSLASVKAKVIAGRIKGSQTDLYFCRTVDHNGNPNGALYPGIVGLFLPVFKHFYTLFLFLGIIKNECLLCRF